MINPAQERRALSAMIRLYCRTEHEGDPLCRECRVLEEYALERLENCPFGTEKPTCQHCPVHCYQPEMRRRIRLVMRTAGPRMIFHHPLLALRHLLHQMR